MSKSIIGVLIGLILISMSCAKEGFEYGGTTLFFENQNYLDGYRFNHNAAGQNTFLTQRTYLTGYYNISTENRVRLTLDSGGYHTLFNANNNKDAAADNHMDSWIFVKFLYWESTNFNGWFDKLYVGQIETPWIGFEDKIMGKRFMLRSLLDLYGVTFSADRGIGAKGKLLGNDEYHVVIDGGSGFKVQDVDGKINLEGRYTYFLTEQINSSLGFGTGWAALKGLAFNPASAQDWAEVARVDFTAANINYKAKDALIVSFTTYRKVFDDDGQRQGYTTHSAGTSWSFVKTIQPQLDLIARLDLIDPDININQNKTQRSYLGTSYVVNENVTVGYCRQADSNEAGLNKIVPAHIDYIQAQVVF